MTLLPAILLLACGSDTKLGRINEPPAARISSPSAESPWRQGEGEVLLTGVVEDDHDAPGDLAAWWEIGEARHEVTADADGAVTLSLDVDTMAPGPQRVALAVTDSDGAYGEHVLEYVLMGPVGAPAVEITAPADGSRFARGSEITFQGTASDETTPVEDLVFAWESDLDGTLAGAVSSEGRSVLVTGLGVGEHRVTLSVTDTDGDVGSDSITVTVDDEGGGSDSGGEPGEDAEPGDLVISEIMVDPDVVYDTAGEYFELYNASDRVIEIEGYTLRDDDYDTWVISESMRILPGDFFLLCAELDPSDNGGVEACDAWFLRPDLPPPGMAFGNNGDEIYLVRPDGVEIDRLIYEDSWVRTAVAIAVDPRRLTADGNDDPDSWCEQTTVITWGGEPGTPGTENDRCW